MIIEIFPCGPLYTNAYLIGCEKSGMAAVIDPAYQSFDQVTSKAEGLSLILEKILLTHSHWDHIADVHDFKERLGLPVYIHPLDVPNLENPGVDGVPTFFPIEGVKPDVLIKEGQIIDVGQLRLEVIHTPGHSPGSVCFYVPKHGILLSGDTLFEGSIGNLSLSTSDPDSMWPSLEKLAKLPPGTQVFPGHGNPTQIGKETWLSKAKKIFGETL